MAKLGQNRVCISAFIAAAARVAKKLRSSYEENSKSEAQDIAGNPCSDIHTSR